MSTLFIALQCYQCSTMQVKQKKKSSNKWSCAICNQKQSVRRVFAQGFMATDVRKFVQDFNMSRKSFDDGELPLAGTLDPAPGISDGEVSRQKKRNDWSAYLDQEDHHTLEEQQLHNDDDCERLVVTELPTGMFKKSRVTENNAAGSGKCFKKTLFLNSQEDPVIQRATSMIENNPKRRKNNLTQYDQVTQKFKQTSTEIASKWSGYLNEYDDNSEFGLNKSFNMDKNSGSCDNIVLETIANERVEDDIHPDFM
ncbi:hypothetical protein LR48_Vigan10g186700 [Vigna angularis]|uniref:MRN complex-interacting protein N-terminal domain-containing protein n=2 Tax=Phaseolus angularis TaxID=3914 RepID=A0A0L9VLS3_PHAAN|nr:uncharacterized protein LOC108345315 [Vigna angularis]KAG2384501.1 uncharacterized protein HKW66_Vig0147350 [Vigna angularis]KOM55975.1 hypothetical protein LR48_Vigan10g186700 [Vigna angularis]BAU01829.1 hypothetical protein VIGAN_11114900 [Vigna angularis var. angularis]